MVEIVKYVALDSAAAAVIERFREGPLEHEYEIIQRMGRKAAGSKSGPQVDGPDVLPGTGCDIGDGVILENGEKMYCFRYKGSLLAKKPEGIAIVKARSLYIDGQRIEPSKGSLVQPALQFVQKKLNDLSPTGDGFVSLNAWEHWYVQRVGRLVMVGSLRTPNRVGRRTRKRPELTVDDIR